MTDISIEQQIEELEAAGWKKKSAMIWVDPHGKLFLGPHYAWEIMRKHSPDIGRAVALANAWKKYVDLFGELPHGTIRQMAALLVFFDAAGKESKRG